MKQERIKERREVRAQAKAEGRKFKQVWAEHLEKKKQEQEEKAKQEEEEKARKEAEDKAKNPSQEELLKQILTTLKEMKKE